MLSIIAALFFAAAPPHVPVDSLRIHISGPLATLEMIRQIRSNPSEGDRAKERVFDLALPDGAMLLDGTLSGSGKPLALLPTTVAAANAVLAQSLAKNKITPSSAPADDGVDARIRLSGINQASELKLRAVVPIACVDGHFVLRLPTSLDDPGSPLTILLDIDGLPPGKTLRFLRLAGMEQKLPKHAKSAHLAFESKNRAAMDIAFALDNPKTDRSPFPAQVLSATGKSGKKSLPWHAATLCRGFTPSKSTMPAQVIFLVDGSSSMGKGGISDERALVSALAKALPPNTLVNAVLFGRSATLAFPLSRMATREVIGGLTANLDPNRIENGTNLVAALAQAKSILAMGAVSHGPTWIVILTDGDLPADQSVPAFHQALGDVASNHLKILTLFVRSANDEEVPVPARQVFADLVSPYGGLVRAIPPGNPEEVAKEIVSAMTMGGDLLNVRAGEVALVESIPPGKGRTFIWWSKRAPNSLRARLGDGTVSRPIFPIPLPGISLERLREKRALVTQEGAIASAVIPQIYREAEDGVVRGQMDPQVLRNALSLAFMPRARACYVSRRVVNAGDAYLRGRLRLSLTLSRGELQDATIRSSTLGNPEIDTCVRQAAYAIEYPRPEHRDAPTVANLNLVFRPSTPEEVIPDASAIDREIELVLAPLLAPADGKGSKSDAGR